MEMRVYFHFQWLNLKEERKRNSLCIFFKLLLIPNVSFGTSSSSKYASHQIPGLGRH